MQRTLEKNAFRCIGGPYDGRDVAWPFHKNKFDVAIPKNGEGPFTAPDTRNEHMDVAFERFTYVKLNISQYLGDPICVWAPEGTSPADVIRQLLENYKGA